MLAHEQLECLEMLTESHGRILIDADSTNISLWSMSGHLVDECLGIGADLEDALIMAAES